MANEIPSAWAITPVGRCSPNRQQREASALRENLKRRKQQQRARENPEAIPGDGEDTTHVPADPMAPGRRTDIKA